ncbi:MAG: hypothetical protein PHV17_05630, partial [Candidatus Omnitrophica bacterium]|nr:hypothetical protein [Candidatus Omnitrophota bacterium]
QFLRLVLPPKATLWSAFVSGKPVKPAIDKEGNVLIPLEKSQLQGEDLRQFPVEIVYLDKFKKMNFFGGSLKMTLPKVDIPLSEVYWSVYFPQGYKYFYADGDVKPVKVYTPNLVKKAISNEIGNIGSQYSSVVTRYQDKPSINKGVLPIKVTVPRQGQLLKFSKLLVTEEEAPWVKLRYTIFVKYLVRTFWIVLILFLAFLLLKKIQRGAKIKTEI